MFSQDKILEISKPQVMQSAAGFYIGASCQTELTYDDGEKQIITEPYDRYSGYYATEAEAKYVLEVDFNDE